ncbi:GntR family transcriptional regulator [Fictibacillus nanhaiensis]|uniref:GntR family transcriptional regulator n=1 Tax=Fictibacillus nanhaiensis TaxID=742169 RepID=UPI00203B1F4E|nr:GntR family transcriptional regulator [Fictibacillus nanhaiensis]MCM3733519.1 GntR family transcriptional regulator [Fictibacillus nanhaiensis]
MNQGMLQKAIPYYEQVQQTIKERIFSGIYEPGDRLYEVQIAREFAISRSPVREAIRALINEGLLIMDDKSQISVYEPSLKDVYEIYECRVSLESTAVALVAQKADENQILQLEKTLSESATAIKNGEKEEMACLNAKFHELIIDFSDNMRLKKLVNELKSLTNYYRFLNLEGEDRPNVIYRGHFEIYQAIKERNPEKASQKLKEHTHDDLENLVNLLNHKRER